MRLLIGIPSTRQYYPFLESFKSLQIELSKKYSFDVLWKHNMLLQDAQNEIANSFMDGDYSHLLFLDDDHWGHTIEMVEALFMADVEFITMKSYSRHYPYQCALMKKISYSNNVNRYVGVEEGSGIHKVDMTGFPMTLIKRSLFEKMQEPYFIQRNSGGTEWATDEAFSDRLQDIGVDIYGCFDFCLPHGDITQENVIERRRLDAKSEGMRLKEAILRGRSRILKDINNTNSNPQ